ncbi:MAG: AraC family transcriptional regulator [Victivallaceae bacterium]|nr:AraC family transcriptional regulator [Victivallaceae bacterium]
MKQSKKYFRASSFFSPDFAFNIVKYSHSNCDFNERVRCRREFWKIIYVESGFGWKVVNDKKYQFKPGGIFLIHPDDSTTFIIESDKIEIYNILFMPQLLEPAINDLNDDFDFFTILHRNFHQEVEEERREMLYVLDSGRDIHLQIKALKKEFNAKQANFRNSIKLKLLDLLIQISRLSSKKIKRRRAAGVVLYIGHIINKHYAEDFDLGVLASRIGFDKSVLCRMFKAGNCTTITHALREKRLEVASRMLISTGKDISEICYECGFNDLSYFYKAFKVKTGLNPGDYRKKFGLY